MNGKKIIKIFNILIFLIVAGALNTPNKLDIFPVALEEDAENESLTVRFTIV